MKAVLLKYNKFMKMLSLISQLVLHPKVSQVGGKFKSKRLSFLFHLELIYFLVKRKDINFLISCTYFSIMKI